jgi:hypothetical protein
MYRLCFMIYKIELHTAKQEPNICGHRLMGETLSLTVLLQTYPPTTKQEGILVVNLKGGFNIQRIY